MLDDDDRGPTPRTGIMQITPYKGGEGKIPGVENPVKLSSNENALGASPKAKAAYIAAADKLELYPDGAARGLRAAIAETHALDPARIICGAGSDELLQLLARTYAGPGADEILFSEYGFLVYRLAAMQVGCVPVTAPETAYTVDVDAMLAKVSDRTEVVYLANPNNPTGTYLKSDELRRLHAGLSPDTVLVIDAAYAEFVDDPDYEDGIALATEFNNVVTTRTFSKIYGLASLRVGWAYGAPRIIEAIDRMRGPFNVTTPAMAAAEAAIRDTDFLAQGLAHNRSWLKFLIDELAPLGIVPNPGVGNFLLLKFPNTPGKTAADADAHLRSKGLILRGLKPYKLGDCLRLTVGREEPNRRVAAALKEFMGA